MTPYFDFRLFGDNQDIQGQGRALEGRIETAAGSLVQRALLHLTDQWKGRVSCGHYITIWIFSVAPDGNTFFWEAFRGKVCRVRAMGDYLLVEAASYAAALLTTSSPVLGWHNTTASDVLSDLLAQASLSLDSDEPDGFGKVLHAWNTEGGLLATEISSLLATFFPSLLLFSDYLSQLLLGDRATLAQLYAPLAFPADASLRELGTDLERTVFPLWPATAGQAVFDPFQREFIGTTDQVVHQIHMGRGSTQLILDRAEDSVLDAYVDNNAPRYDPSKATP